MWQVTAQSEVALPKAWLGALSKVNLKPLTLLRFYLLGWAQPHVQHDVAELATLLLRNLGWVPCAISWCRRVQVAGGFRNLQTMQDARLLHLDPDQGLHPSDLQDVIRSWHGVIAVQALHSAPAMIWTQLPRFVHRDGRVQKVTKPLRLGADHRRISLPGVRLITGCLHPLAYVSGQCCDIPHRPDSPRRTLPYNALPSSG